MHIYRYYVEFNEYDTNIIYIIIIVPTIYTHIYIYINEALINKNLKLLRQRTTKTLFASPIYPMLIRTHSFDLKIPVKL